ncbi:MAG TPA: iron-sulfur cluster assembly scaffold protein [Dehalococcoidia bacterium]
MDRSREEQLELLLEHYRNPYGKGKLEDADVVMPGGNPGCGDIVTIYLKGDEGGAIRAVRFEGQGCTISQAAASILMELVEEDRLTMDDVVEMDGSTMMDILGRDLVSTRPKCATLALGTLKSAVKRYRAERRLAAAEARESEAERGLVFGEGAVEASRTQG